MGIGTSHVEDQGRSNGRISSCEETDCLILSFGVYNKIIIIMTRGNQRDKAREKAAKADKGKTKAASEQAGNKGLNMEQRKQREKSSRGRCEGWRRKIAIKYLTNRCK